MIQTYNILYIATCYDKYLMTMANAGIPFPGKSEQTILLNIEHLSNIDLLLRKLIETKYMIDILFLTSKRTN